MGSDATWGDAADAITLTNDVGLHARPSVKLTQAAKRFQSRIELATSLEGPWIDAKSPVKIMRMKAIRGEVLHFRAFGKDAQQAVDTLVDLVRRRFDEG